MSKRLKKIWIVDDDEGILDVLKLILVDEGFRVKAINNGKDLLLKLKREQPDLILLDIFMSGIDGRDISKFLKKRRKTKNVPVIIMSAGFNIINRPEEIAADDFIIKPFNIEFMLKLINTKLDGSLKHSS